MKLRLECENTRDPNYTGSIGERFFGKEDTTRISPVRNLEWAILNSYWISGLPARTSEYQLFKLSIQPSKRRSKSYLNKKGK